MWCSGSFPLFIQAEPTIPVDSRLTLFVAGVAGSGWMGGLPLYTYSDASGNILTKGLPLFLSASQVGSGSKTFPLSVHGAWPTTGGSVELTLWNAQSGVLANTTLFVKGSGVTAGAIPFGNAVPLFLRRAPAWAMTLHVGSPGYPSESGLHLYVYGQVPGSGQVPLSIPSVVGNPAEMVRLYVNGY